MRKLAAYLFGFGLCLVLAPTNGRAQYSVDERFLSGLRAYRLFDLADEVCRNRLAASNLTSRERVTITIERMLVQTEKGVNAPLAERPAAFVVAREIAAEFAKAHGDNPRALLVQFQDALTVLTLGELQRLEAELGTASTAELDGARKTLNDSVALLEQLDSELQKRIPETRRTPGGKEEVSVEELNSLRTHVGYQLARATRNQGQLYPEKSEDRTAVLLRGKRRLEESIQSLTEEEVSFWRALIELATFERMLGDLPRAANLLADVEAKSPPAHSIAALRAEQIRLLITSGKATNAVAQGSKWAASITPRDADLDLAFLEAVVAEKGAAKSADSLMEMLAELESRHGPYWGRRGSALVLSAAPAGAASENMELLSRTADQLYLQKNFDAAIAAYDKAAIKAKEKKMDPAFVDLANRAAQVEQHRKGHSEAARRFLELAAAPEAKSIAADLHLAAAWNQAQLVSVSPNDASASGRYEEILKEQVAKFKESPTAETAKLWLARFYESRGEYQQAFDLANSVSASAKERDEALALCLRYWNRRAGSFAQGAKEQMTAALLWAKGAEGDLSTTLQRRVRAASVGWELLNRSEINHSEAEARLRELLEKAPPAEEECISAARTLLVVALAAQPSKHEEAARLLLEAGGTAKQRLTALLGLAKVMKSAGKNVKPPLAEFVLGAIKKLQPSVSELSANEKLQVDLAYADGLEAKGDPQANAVFAALAKKHANSGIVQEAYAIHLSQLGDSVGKPENRTRALEQWRIVAFRSEPRTERWYRAKYYVAKTQAEMGDKAGAAKLVDYLDATPPGLKGAPLEAEFRSLRQGLGP